MHHRQSDAGIFSAREGRLEIEHLPVRADAAMFGSSHLPSEGLGAPLEDSGYREEEFLVSGRADLWRHTEHLAPEIAVREVPFATRAIVRAPQREEDFSGCLHLEPLHPDLDGAISWRMLHPHLIASGHAHMGLSAFSGAVDLLRDVIDGERYGRLSLPEDGLAYDIFAQLLVVICRSERIARRLLGRVPERIFISGWSATGSFCRIIMNEGFHSRSTRPDGQPCIDGALIAISSGARSFGYPALSSGSPVIPVGEPRRIVQPARVPIIELLTEFEVETNASTWRPDADGDADRYRQYHVAGASHSTDSPCSAATVAARQLELAGATVGRCEVNEEPSNARLNCVARAVTVRLERWAQEEVPPPSIEPFTRLEDPQSGLHGLSEGALPLDRDRYGNVVGGLRTLWTDVPAATYLPHSTPRPSGCVASPFAPVDDPPSLADLRGHRVRFARETMVELYGDGTGYRRRLTERSEELIGAGWLLPRDAPDLVQQLTQDWPASTDAKPQRLSTALPGGDEREVTLNS